MITPEYIAQLLISCETKESISDIQIQSDSAVDAKLDNWVEPKRPYKLLVFLYEQGLSITAGPFSKLRNDRSTFRCVVELNFLLLFGCLNIQPQDGTLTYRADHFYVDNDNDLDPGLFEWLLCTFIKKLRCIEQFMLFASLVELGIPADRADQCVIGKLGDSPVAGWYDLLIAKRDSQKC